MAFMLYFLQEKQLASSFAEKNHSFPLHSRGFPV